MSFTSRQTGNSGKTLAPVIDAAGAHFIVAIDHQAPTATKFYDSFADLAAGVESATPPVLPISEGESGGARSDYIQTLTPVPDGAWDPLQAVVGPRFSSTSHPNTINRPAAVTRNPATGNLVLGSYYKPPTEVSVAAGSIVRELPIAYQAPSTAVDGHAYTFSIAYSPSGAKIALGSTSRDVVNVYDAADGTLLSRVGSPGAPGDPHAGKLNNVYGDCLFLDENTLAAPSYNGSATGTTKAGWGSVSLWNITAPTALFLSYALWPSSDPANAIGSSDVRRPMDIIRDPANTDRAWIASYGSARIIQCDTSATPWAITDVVSAPAGVSINSPYGFDISADGAEMVIAPHSNDLVVIDLASKAAITTIPKAMFGMTGDWRDVSFVDDQSILVCDWAAAAAILIPRLAEYDVPYSALTVPRGRRVDRLAHGAPGGLDIADPGAPVLQVPAAALARVGPVDVLFAAD